MKMVDEGGRWTTRVEDQRRWTMKEEDGRRKRKINEDGRRRKMNDDGRQWMKDCKRMNNGDGLPVRSRPEDKDMWIKDNASPPTLRFTDNDIGTFIRQRRFDSSTSTRIQLHRGTQLGLSHRCDLPRQTFSSVDGQKPLWMEDLQRFRRLRRFWRPRRLRR